MRIVDGFRLRDVMGQATVIGEGVGQVNFNKLITLNESAAYLWESVEGKDFEAADLSALLVEKYDIDFVQPYDMFPQTANVETLVCLRLR